MEDGQVIGVLETEAQGDETSLPPGKCNLFLAKEGNDCHTYAESGGRIVGGSSPRQGGETTRGDAQETGNSCAGLVLHPVVLVFWLALGHGMLVTALVG